MLMVDHDDGCPWCLARVFESYMQLGEHLLMKHEGSINAHLRGRMPFMQGRVKDGWAVQCWCGELFQGSLAWHRHLQDVGVKAHLLDLILGGER